MPPEHNIAQLSYEAAMLLKISASKVRKLKIVRRSVDARKKPDIRIVYTVDATVDGNEKKILRDARCKRASLAPVSYYKVPKCGKQPQKRPVVVGFGPAGMFAALILSIGMQLWRSRKEQVQKPSRQCLVHCSGVVRGYHCCREYLHRLWLHRYEKIY